MTLTTRFTKSRTREPALTPFGDTEALREHTAMDLRFALDDVGLACRAVSKRSSR